METINGMHVYTKDELKVIIEEHHKWLFGEGGARADLTSADLTSANLTSADLTSANLTSADLTSANLTSADLTSANLTSADLTYANLRYANLTSANLTYANLTSANLTSANLTSANLTSANLRYANLRYAKGGMTKEPITINGLRWSVLILDAEVIIGCQRHSLKRWREFTDAQIKKMDYDAPEFAKTWLPHILAMAAIHCEVDEPLKEIKEEETSGKV